MQEGKELEATELVEVNVPAGNPVVQTIFVEKSRATVELPEPEETYVPDCSLTFPAAGGNVPTEVIPEVKSKVKGPPAAVS